MERGLLSDEKLAAHYDDVVWMYLYQDFSHDEADRRAERVAIRFGISSWPQHFLVDPFTLEVLADTERSLGSFAAAVERVGRRTAPDGGGVPQRQLLEWDRLAASLEEADVDVAEARARLGHEDVVVRFRAVQALEAREPAAVVAAANDLLDRPHDQTRFAVCKLLAAHGTAENRAALEALVSRPEPSKNPNVLRIRAVEALARCGDADSVSVVAPFASSGAYFNGLTRVSIATLVALAERFPAAVPRVREALAAGFPEPEPEMAEREARACAALARHIHDTLSEMTGLSVGFPDAYAVGAAAQLREAWSRR